MSAATRPVVAGPAGMRPDLVPVLRELSEVPASRRADRALALQRVAATMRAGGLAAVGVAELEQLADAIRTGGWS